MKKKYILGGFVYPRCIVKNGKRICRPGGKRYKFRRYTKV